MQSPALTDTDSKDWRRKYSEVVHAMEADERQYQAQLLTLKRLIGRLCLVGNGQSPQLDEVLLTLKEVITREQVPAAELDSIAAAIASVVLEEERRATDNCATPRQNTSAVAATAVDPRLLDALSRLLGELRRDPELIQSIDKLGSELAMVATTAMLSPLVQQVGVFATQRIRNLEKLRSGLEKLLEQMVARLDEVAGYIAGDETSRQQEHTRRAAFTDQIAGEMQAIGTSVEASDDLAQIRTQIRSRLDSIGRHLQDFRQRETDFASTAQQRATEMRARITELEQETSELQQRVEVEKRNAMLDALTQVPNRLGWEQRIKEELQRWQQFPQATCLLTWDIDHFKRINDSYGHTAGDKVLNIVAGRLAKGLRSNDFLARYGGEEFVMILPATTLEKGAALANAIREAVAKIGFHFSGKAVVITISCGLTLLCEGDTVTSAFERADKALYQAKQNGRNQVASG